MNRMILFDMPQEFQRLAFRAAESQDYEADLAALIERLKEAAGNGPDWRVNVGKVRGQLRLMKTGLKPPQCAFYENAIGRLTTMMEET